MIVAGVAGARLWHNRRAMNASLPVRFIREEIVGSLPSGWGLVGDLGSWDRRRATWSVAVYDSADNAWDIAVSGADAERLGRIEALQRAIDRVYREALG